MFLKALYKRGATSSKNKARMMLLIAFCAVCGVGIGSTFFFGNDNVIEEKVEDILENMIEIQIELPAESLHGWIDLSPSSTEKKESLHQQ